jgi:hypothetical protein
MIKEFKGIMTVTTLDGTVINVTSRDQIASIPLGSKIEMVTGKAVLAIAGIKVIVERGHKLQISEDPVNGAYEFNVLRKSRGNIALSVGSTVVALNKDNILSVKVNEPKGTADMLAVIGNMQVASPTGKVTLQEGSDMMVALPLPTPIVRERANVTEITPIPVAEPQSHPIEEASPTNP